MEPAIISNFAVMGIDFSQYCMYISGANALSNWLFGIECVGETDRHFRVIHKLYSSDGDDDGKSNATVLLKDRVRCFVVIIVVVVVDWLSALAYI